MKKKAPILISILLMFFTCSLFSQNEKNNELISAIKSNNLKEVSRLFYEEHVNLNIADTNLATPLMWAAYKADLEMVKFLVGNGANPKQNSVIFLNSKENTYYGSLVAIAAGEGNLCLLQYLITDSKIPVDYKEYDPTTNTNNGWTALQWAAFKGNDSIVKYLVDKGADINNQLNIEFISSQIHVLKNEYAENDTAIYAKYLYYNAWHHTENLNWDKAEQYYLGSMLVYKNQGFVLTPFYLKILDNLANLYLRLLKYNKALPLYREIVENKQGLKRTNELSYRVSLEKLANAYRDMGQYKIALPLYLENFAYANHQLTEGDFFFRQSLNGLAVLYLYMGEYNKALPLFQKDLEITGNALGKKDLEYGTSLNCLAILYQSMGLFDIALPLLLEDLAIAENTLGRSDPDYGVSLNCVAKLYGDMGEYEKAMTLSIEAIEITGRSVGKNHLEYGISLRNLADLYNMMGQYEKALPLYLNDLMILEKTLGKKHPDYGINLRNPANIYRDLGNYEKALPLYLESLDIIEKSLGKYHPSYSRSLNGLAVLYLYIGQYDKALPLFQEDLEITEKTLGRDHPEYGTSLNCLAFLYQSMGQYEHALPLFQEDLEITEKTLGKDHPQYGTSLYCLAELYFNMGQYDCAEPYFLATTESLMAQLQKDFTFALDSEKEAIYLKIFKDIDISKSFFFQRKTENPSIVKAAYDNELALKGVQLQSEKMMRQSILQSNNGLLAEKFDDWLIRNEHINRLLNLPISERSLNIDSLKTIADGLERELTVSSMEFNNFRNTFRIRCQDVQNSLKDQEVAIEFVSFRYYNGRHYTDSIYYAALLFRKEYAYPKMVLLTEEKPLKELLSHAALVNCNNINELYSCARGVGTFSGKYQNTYYSTYLYQLIWQPIDSLLQGIHTVYYSPSGLLHKISFASVSTGNKNDPTEVLMDKYDLNYVSSTRQVIKNYQQDYFLSANTTASLYGGINYEWKEGRQEIPKQKQESELFSFQFGRSGFIPNDSTRSEMLLYLPGTLTEATTLDLLLKSHNISSESYSGVEATEELFKSQAGVQSPEIIHLATHGFFFEQPENKIKDEDFQRLEQQPFRYVDDPLLRSGILLAGANRKWSGEEIPTDAEDGILTAKEVSNLNLGNTKLVVLSACETGLGDVKGSEGVYGLQRAFKMAGVDYILMSLWKVPDKETVEMMELFYTNMINGMSVREAFRMAQNQMKQKYSPYYWAAFVLIE